MDKYFERLTPAPLEEFLLQDKCIERDIYRTEAYLYHGTNCWRRWEINRTGAILPGRSNYSFFSSSEEDAFNYARNACLRDIRSGGANSLTCEPVVLKVRFNERFWIQVDFIQKVKLAKPNKMEGITAAILGPIPTANIVSVTNCAHDKPSVHNDLTVRSFADGTLIVGIQRIKQKTKVWRLDTWLLAKMQSCLNTLSLWCHGAKPKLVTDADELNRLLQIELRLKSS